MDKIAGRNSMLMIVMILCTITIISTNYMFNKQSVIDINETLMENEYKKIGGKENYILMQEIQKREILAFIDKIKTEQPELVNEILSSNELGLAYKVMSQNIINDLKKDTYIKGNTGATVSIIDFSDLECPFCIKDHNELDITKLIEGTGSSVNYIFKNFPLPSHKNAGIEAEASKCVESIAGGEKYLEYINNIFSTTKGGGEGYKIEDLSPLAKSLEVDTDKFEACMTNGETKSQVEKEFKQGAMLGINSVPSKLILNNVTGKYTIISEVTDTTKLQEIIDEISK
ncbi:MAG: thioredoxin domain-containing protein [Candidatus Gracilibacteria bacterium]|nr:thioredoxin domain-containing protein [Candidatus Gracilibacteria bacterium]